MGGVLDWSTTPGSNTTVDGVNIAEGMQAGLVNNGMRAIMALVREWQLDASGVVTAGAGDAYTITSNQGIAAYADGLRFSFRADRNNTGAATLNVDGHGAKALRKTAAGALAALAADDLVAEAVYDVVYDVSSDVFVIVGTHGVAGLTAFGQSLISAANDAAGRTVLSLGTVATESIVPLAKGGTGVALVDPNADRILFWDDSAGTFTWLSVAGNLSISGTTLTAKTSRLTYSLLNTNGLTNVDFGGIPAGVNEIIVGFMQTSGTATAQLLVQLRVGGVAVTAGYFNTGGLTSGFSLPSLLASQMGSGTMRLYKADDGTWTMDSGASGTAGTLSTDPGVVDGIRLVHSTGNFDNTGYGRAWIAWRD